MNTATCDCGAVCPIEQMEFHDDGGLSSTYAPYCSSCIEVCEKHEKEDGVVAYKCRAESQLDVQRVMNAWHQKGVAIYDDFFVIRMCEPEWVIKIISAHTHDDLLRFAKDVLDAHVLRQTLELKENYTGVRNMDRE